MVMNTLQTDLTNVFEGLTQFATLADFWQRFETIYGKEYDADLAEALRSQWARGDYSQLPAMEVLKPEVLGDAVGAYAASLNKIYLSESFLATATLSQSTAVILEEIGHFVDAQINATDTPGDEGELFAALVLDRPLSPAEWHRIRQENDLCTVTIDGQEVALEQASAIKSGIFPTAGSDPGNLTNVNGTLYFTADDGVHGRELWKSDGNGTVLVKDILSGSNSSYPGNLNNVNGTLYFTAYDGVNGSGSWTSNGTPEGTIRISDSGSFPLQNLIIIDGILYFTADDEVNGQELWKSDSIGAGRVLVKDIVPGPGGSYPGGLTNANGILYFISQTCLYPAGPHNYIRVFDGRLWKSDGTPEGTILLKKFPTRASYDYFSSLIFQTNIYDTLYFSVTFQGSKEKW
jgi:ELWxxDGT repeat protein